MHNDNEHQSYLHIVTVRKLVYRNMGSWFSSEKKSENAENIGNSNTNNVVIQEPVEVEHGDLLILVYIITVVCVIRLLIDTYRMYYTRMKKKFYKQRMCQRKLTGEA